MTMPKIAVTVCYAHRVRFDNHIAVPLTFSQLKQLTVQTLTDRLVLRRQYALALRICQYLKVMNLVCMSLSSDVVLLKLISIFLSFLLVRCRKWMEPLVFWPIGRALKCFSVTYRTKLSPKPSWPDGAEAGS